MALEEYLDWQSRRQGAGMPTPRPAPQAVTVPSQEDAGAARPGAGIHGQPPGPAGATLVQRVYAALGKRS